MKHERAKGTSRLRHSMATPRQEGRKRKRPITKAQKAQKHEKEVFEKVTQARASMTQAGTIKQKADATNMLTSALKSLFAVVENYPELKANQNFLLLQEELSGIESKIAYARQFYNDTVMNYNRTQQLFPSNIVASLFGFTLKDYFEIKEPGKREAPRVDFK